MIDGNGHMIPVTCFHNELLPLYTVIFQTHLTEQMIGGKKEMKLYCYYGGNLLIMCWPESTLTLL